MTQDELKLLREDIIKQYTLESSAWYATARVWDDGIIDPRDSRRILGGCLQLLMSAKQVKLQPNSFGTARI